MKTLNLFYCTLVLGVFLTSGCENEENATELPDKILTVEQEESILLNFGDFNSFIQTFKLGQEYATESYSVAQLPLDNKEFTNFLNELDIELPVVLGDIFSVVLFTDKISEFDPTSDANTQALCLYYLKDGLANLSFYRKQNNRFNSDPVLTAGTQGAISSTLKYLLHHQTSTKDNPGYLVILNYEYDLSNIKWQFESIGLYADEARRKAYKGLITTRGKPCDCPVVEPPPNCHFNYQTCDYTFDDDCRAGQTEFAGNLVSNMGSDTVWTAHDTILHFSLRDNVLVSLDKGYSVVNLYYHLNAMMTAQNIHPSLSIKLRTTRLLYFMHTPIYKLVNHQSYANDIFLTNQNAGIFLDLLDDYRALSSTAAWTGSIDEVKGYVDECKGQTIGYIINNF